MSKVVPPVIAKKSSPSRWYRVNLWLHRWVSLVVTIPFLILCITGTILIFHEEIDSAMGIIPPAPGLTGTARPLVESVETVLTAYPDKRVLYLSYDAEKYPGLLRLSAVPKGDRNFDRSTPTVVDMNSARLVERPASREWTLTGFLLELHAQWFLGVVGELIGAFLALLVLISLLSGLVVYAPHARRVAFGVLRKGRGPRLMQLDLHNLIGAIVLGWAFVVTLTGLLLGFGTVATGLWAQGELTHAQQLYGGAPVDPVRPPVNVDRAHDAALASAPAGWSVRALFWPGTDYSTPAHYTVLVGGSGVDEKLFKVALVDATTGHVPAVAEQPWYMKGIALSEPLHFGDYGGLPLKLLWTACTWLTLFITGNGAWLWWDRRRSRRKPKRERRAT